MINQQLEKAIEGNQSRGEFIYPDYDKHCFSSIPSTILSLFGIKPDKPLLAEELYQNIDIKPTDKIVLLLIDAFGFNQWKLYSQDNDFFRDFTQKGLISPITTVFPSTTSSTLTTISSGLTPQEHGLIEWHLYFKEVDMILETLPFTPMDEKLSGEFKKKKPNPKMLFNKETIYQKLKKNGVKSFVFKNKSYAYSDYSKLIDKGGEVVPFIKTSDLAVNLRKKLETEKGPAYFHVYYDGIDSIQHKYGPYTEQHSADMSLLSFSLQRFLLDKLDKKVAKDVVLIVTSDHGQVNIPPEKAIYLNGYKKLVANFQKSRKRKLILPWGLPRDVFLSIKPDKLDEIENYLSKKLKNRAKVMKTDDAFREGLFGRGKVHKQFWNRVGNLMILPYRDSLIWYKHVKGKKVKTIGHHGGLSKDEMLVPFGVIRVSDIIKRRFPLVYSEGAKRLGGD